VHGMIWVGCAFIGIVLFSILVGVLRGFVREALSLASWVLAFVLSLRYAPMVADALQSSIQTPSVRTVAAYAVVFLAVLLVGALLTWAITTLVKSAGLGGVDRMLGAGLGLIRGVLISIVVVMLVANSAAKDESWWHRSLFVPRLEPLAADLQGLIPENWLVSAWLLKPESAKSKVEH
jgi:membrane protein required for colicin V production